MVRIVGVSVPDSKRIDIALTYIHGIGMSTATKVLNHLKIDPSKKPTELTSDELKTLYEYIEKNVPVEGVVKQKVFMNIKRLKDIKCYRGNRHKLGLPVRGQNTRKNAKTRKGRSIAVANKKKESK